MLEALTSRQAVLARAKRGAGVALLGVVALVAASEGTQTAQANGDTRTLTLYHTHRGDTLTVTFKRNGRYDAEGLRKLSYFLRDWRNDKQTRMEPRLFDIVWEVHREVGRGQMINIVSSYRSPETNAMLRARSRGVAKFSQHMLGRAMDFYITGVPVSAVREAGIRLQRGGVGFYPTSGRPFVHLDAGNIRAWPRMSRSQLARLFPGGKTVHQPAEGGHMPGYQVAAAELKARGGVSLDDAYSGSGGGKSKGFFARLFGSDDEDETEVAPTVVATAATRRAASARTAAPAASDDAEETAPPASAIRVATVRVPVPTPRPAGFVKPAAPVEEEAPVVMAAATPVAPLPPIAPIRPAAVAPTVVAAVAPAPVPAPREPEMVWRAGPGAAAPAPVAEAPASAAEPAMALASAIPAPRPRPADSAVAVLAAIPTPVSADRSAQRPREINPQTAAAYQAEAATFPRLPDAFVSRAPAAPEMTMAYAAPQTAQLPVENRSRPAAPQAQHKPIPAPAVAAAKPASHAPASSVASAPRVIAPDATPSAIYAAASSAARHASLPAAPMVTARLDDRTLRAAATPTPAAWDQTLRHPQPTSSGLIDAPTAALAGGFGVDPSYGAKPGRFSGSSVMLLRTQSFAAQPANTTASIGNRRG